MKNLRKVMAFLLLLALIVSFSACGTQQTQGNATPTPTQASVAPSASADTSVQKDPETGLTPMADRTPITFTVFIRDPGQAPSPDNPVLKKITELTGVTIAWEFLVGDLNEKVGVMLAGGEYPDVMFGADAKKFFDAGALIPVEDLLNKYPNTKAHYAPFMKSMIAGFDGKHAYTIENYGAILKAAPIFQNGGAGFFLQKAVIEDAGYKVPKTVDEYFSMIENYMAKYPTIDGVPTIGYEILCDGWRDFCLRNPAMHLMGNSNQGDCFVDYTTLKASLYQTSDTAKAWYKKLNEEYQKGVIQPESFTETYDQYIARLSTGAVLGIFDQQWNFGNGENLLKAAGKDNRTYVCVPLAGASGKDTYLDATALTISGTGGITISTACKNPDRLVAFYDWLLNRDVQDYLQWGIEGKDWVKAGTNGKALTAERRAIMQDTAKKRDLTGDTLWQYTPKMQGLYEDGAPCGPGDSEDEFLASQTAYVQDFYKKLNVKYPAQLLSPPIVQPAFYPVWAMPIEDGTPAKVSNTKMIETCRKYDPQLILADPAGYDALWDKFVAEVAAGEPQIYLDEIDRQIKIKMDAAK